MNEYEVEVSIEYGGYSITAIEIVDSYSEEEAKESAEQKVLDNLLVNGTSSEVVED